MGIDDGNGCTTTGIYLMPLKHTLKNGESKLYVMYILTQLKHNPAGGDRYRHRHIDRDRDVCTHIHNYIRILLY